MTKEDEIVQQIIKRHGEVINLRESPETIIDILRHFRLEDNGGLPGGVPPSPPPGPTSFQGGDPTIRDVMKELLKLSKQVNELKQQLGSQTS